MHVLLDLHGFAQVHLLPDVIQFLSTALILKARRHIVLIVIAQLIREQACENLHTRWLRTGVCCAIILKVSALCHSDPFGNYQLSVVPP